MHSMFFSLTFLRLLITSIRVAHTRLFWWWRQVNWVNSKVCGYTMYCLWMSWGGSKKNRISEPPQLIYMVLPQTLLYRISTISFKSYKTNWVLEASMTFYKRPLSWCSHLEFLPLIFMLPNQGWKNKIVWFLCTCNMTVSIHYSYSIRGTWPRWRKHDKGQYLFL